MYTNIYFIKFGCIQNLFHFNYKASVSLFLFIFLQCTMLSAGEKTLQQQVRFDHITMKQGLSQNNIEVIIQDHRGYLWLGTRNGLNRYDGYNMVVFRHNPEDPHSLRDNVIEALYEDHRGVLWAGTQNGWLEKYDRETQSFTHYKIGSHVLSIMEDSSDTLWIGTQDPGLFQFNRLLWKY